MTLFLRKIFRFFAFYPISYLYPKDLILKTFPAGSLPNPKQIKNCRGNVRKSSSRAQIHSCPDILSIHQKRNVFPGMIRARIHGLL